MADEPSEKKQDLLEQLLRVEENAPKLEKIGQDLIRTARQGKDAAIFERAIIQRIPSDRWMKSAEWEREIERWRAFNASTEKLLTMRTDVNSFVAVSTSTTAAVSLSAFDAIQWPSISEADKDALRLYAVRFHAGIDRQVVVDEVRAEMRRLSLDVRSSAYRSALEILDEAVAGIDVPAAGEGSPIAALVPLRESIDAAVTELVRRRPVTERAKPFREKIHSIGRHCALPALPAGHFERLAEDGAKLLDDLSGAKQDTISRALIIDLFNAGLLYLKGLLASIDAAKLRQP